MAFGRKLLERVVRERLKVRQPAQALEPLARHIDLAAGTDQHLAELRVTDRDLRAHVAHAMADRAVGLAGAAEAHRRGRGRLVRRAVSAG
jgi:hypothetical protein